MGQGQPRVIIWTTLVVFPYMMLHTKFQGHGSIRSGEQDFLWFLPYMGMVAMLVMWPRPFEQLFFPKGPWGCIWNLVAIGSVVSEEKSFEIVDRQWMDGRWTDDGACLYYKLPRSLRLRWAKNCDLDINHRPLKHEPVQDISYYVHSPGELKVEFDQDIFHTKHLCENTAKWVHKRRC